MSTPVIDLDALLKKFDAAREEEARLGSHEYWRYILIPEVHKRMYHYLGHWEISDAFACQFERYPMDSYFGDNNEFGENEGAD